MLHDVNESIGLDCVLKLVIEHDAAYRQQGVRIDDLQRRLERVSPETVGYAEGRRDFKSVKACVKQLAKRVDALEERNKELHEVLRKNNARTDVHTAGCQAASDHSREFLGKALDAQKHDLELRVAGAQDAAVAAAKQTIHDEHGQLSAKIDELHAAMRQHASNVGVMCDKMLAIEQQLASRADQHIPSPFQAAVSTKATASLPAVPALHRSAWTSGSEASFQAALDKLERLQQRRALASAPRLLTSRPSAALVSEQLLPTGSPNDRRLSHAQAVARAPRFVDSPPRRRSPVTPSTVPTIPGGSQASFAHAADQTSPTSAWLATPRSFGSRLHPATPSLTPQLQTTEHVYQPGTGSRWIGTPLALQDLPTTRFRDNHLRARDWASALPATPRSAMMQTAPALAPPAATHAPSAAGFAATPSLQYRPTGNSTRDALLRAERLAQFSTFITGLRDKLSTERSGQV